MKTTIFLAMTFLGFSSYGQNVVIPDKNFEKALIELGIDSDGEINGQVLKSDVLSVTSLDVTNKNIKDLTGLQEFKSLMYLNCGDNKLSYEDFSQNISLIKVLGSNNDVKDLEGNISFLNWFDKF